MHTRTCITCKQTLPSSLFKYRATREEAKRKGLSGNTAAWVESNRCKACRPKRKPPSKLTRNELANRVTAGDVSPIEAERILNERERGRRAKISEYMKVRHAMLKHMSLRPTQLKLFLLEQHIKKEQDQQLKQAQRDAKHSAKLSTPPRKRGRPPKQLIPTTPYGDIVPISQTTQGETNER
jgi:hypothetical protein